MINNKYLYIIICNYRHTLLYNIHNTRKKIDKIGLNVLYKIISLLNKLNKFKNLRIYEFIKYLY